MQFDTTTEFGARAARRLAADITDNFRQFAESVSHSVAAAGPRA